MGCESTTLVKGLQGCESPAACRQGSSCYQHWRAKRPAGSETQRSTRRLRACALSSLPLACKRFSAARPCPAAQPQGKLAESCDDKCKKDVPSSPGRPSAPRSECTGWPARPAGPAKPPPSRSTHTAACLLSERPGVQLRGRALTSCPRRDSSRPTPANLHSSKLRLCDQQRAPVEASSLEHARCPVRVELSASDSDA